MPTSRRPSTPSRLARTSVEERLTIDVVVVLDGEVADRGWAFNEASVEKAARERMLEVVVEIDGRPLSRWGCDGVVFATPTGSTAYAFSAGGPVVWPQVDALLLVPLSAHALFARPWSPRRRRRLAVEVLELNEADDNTTERLITLLTRSELFHTNNRSVVVGEAVKAYDKKEGTTRNIG